MSPDHNMPENPDWLYELMKRLNYKSNPDGVCFGISCMATQAGLIRDLETFEQRLWHMMELYESPSTSTPIDVMAFLDGVEISQLAPHFAHLFSEENKHLQVQSALSTTMLTASMQLDEKKGIAEVDSSINSYSKDQLENSFSVIRRAIDACNIEEPISMLIRNNNHAITIVFDPKNPGWSLIDTRRMNNNFDKPIGFYKNEKGIAEAVYKSFLAEDSLVISTKIYCLPNEAHKIKNMATIWHHDLPIQYQDANQINLQSMLLLAVIENNLDVAKEILSVDKNILRNPAKEISNAMFFAAKHGCAEMVKLLLEHGANANFIYEDGTTPLDAALSHKHRDVIEALLAANTTQVDPNFTRRDGVSPLYYATQENDAASIESLLKAGANPNQAWNDFTPIDLAKYHGNTELVNKFGLFADKSFNQANDVTLENEIVASRKKQPE